MSSVGAIGLDDGPTIVTPMRFAPTPPIAPSVSSPTHAEDPRVLEIGAASAMTPPGPVDADQTECDGAPPAGLLRPSIFETLTKVGAPAHRTNTSPMRRRNSLSSNPSWYTARRSADDALLFAA